MATVWLIVWAEPPGRACNKINVIGRRVSGGMAITIESPEQLKEEFEVIPKTGYYTSTSKFLKDVIKTILSARKDLRISIAIEQYKKGYSVGRAAEIADVNYEEMKRTLVKSGIGVRRGVETVEELVNGARTLKEFSRN